MKFSKKITAIFIAVMMVVSAIPFTASAASNPYLTFTGTDSFSIQTYNSAKNWNGTLEYSTDTNTWTTWDGTSQISSVNNKLYLRGTGNTKITGNNNNSSKYWVITTQGKVACSGDIRTLVDYNNPEDSNMGTYCFAYLFNNCTSLTEAPDLPATRLTESCYSYMFNGCTSLTTAPELPATTLRTYCYRNMFSGCTSLTTAPELPATTLALCCYGGMFQNCTNLTTAPQLPATALEVYCYQNMFNGCESLTTAPVLPATTMADYCYYSMFNGCANLTTAPALPATMLTAQCYSYMFEGCTSLTTAPALPATTLAFYCYYNMFNGCRSLTTAPALPATTLTNGCYQSMFQDCTSLTTPSELPAIDLESNCYNSMFKGCTGIKLSTEQTAEYSSPYSIPKEGTGSMGTNTYNVLTDMFTGTGGTFTGSPSINTTYYIDAPSAYAGYVPAEADDADALAAKVVKFNGYDWYLIEDNSTSETEGTVTLLAADTSFGACAFDSTKTSNEYSTSTIKATLDAMTAEDGSFAKVADAIVATDLTDVNVTGAKLWLLSSGEANNIPVNVRMCSQASEAIANAWWLRSADSDGTIAEFVVGSNGYVANGGTGANVNQSFGVRPALKLDLSKVEFDSSSKTFALPTPAPTSTVSFTKVSSADEIAAENISTCTVDEAAAWIVANWDDIFKGEDFIDVAYYNSSTGSLIVFVISSDTDKKSFEDNYENFIYEDMSADDLKDWFVTYGDTVYLCTAAAPAPTEPNNGASITVAETISENFYLDDEFYGEDSFITVNYNHNSNVSESDDFRTDVVAMNSLPELDDSTSEYNGARKISITQAPAQATEPIEIKVYANADDAQAGENAIDTIDYSVYSYCRQIITGDYAENLKDLARATLDYAASAQDYFDYNTENMATKDATGGFYNNVAGADLSTVAGVSAAPSCITKASVVVKSDLEINLFSLTPIEVTSASMDATKGKDRFAATSYQSGDYYVVHIAGIEPANMDNTITVNTSEGDIVMTANAIIKMMLNSNDAKLVTLAKAMYLYGAAANTYFD
ncbi:MAG: hypothetical protein E7570_05290 [Ruminococcaceae bacterium]|nr:hypothetical protein [Oscillospiraceae bacterium]